MTGYLVHAAKQHAWGYGGMGKVRRVCMDNGVSVSQCLPAAGVFIGRFLNLLKSPKWLAIQVSDSARAVWVLFFSCPG